MTTDTGFAKRFLWGAATSAHQVEGKTTNQWTRWELENASSLAEQSKYHYADFEHWSNFKAAASNPNNYVSGRTANHYENYSTDFDLLEQMNMNAYRFSIEWSRVQPKEGAWDVEAVTHYRDYIADLKSRGIEPIVTLFHFTLPDWFADKGGFEKYSNIRYFIDFAERIMTEVGKGVKYVVTINEPDVYAEASYRNGDWPPAVSSRWRFYRVAMNLVLTHRRTYRALKRVNGRLKIGLTKNSVNYYPGDNAWLSRVSAGWMQWLQDDRYLIPVVRRMDFMGLNYYQSARVYGYRVHNPETADKSDVDWTLTPGDIEYVLQRWYSKYKKPILITENGLADADDSRRQEWLQATIRGMRNAIKDGVELIGYLHWSLIDNFEWAYGKWPRFGLTSINYATGERTLRPSARWFGRVIKKLRGLD